MPTPTTPAGFRIWAGLVTVTALAALVALSVRGAMHGPIGPALAGLAADPWGAATLADLAVGLGFVGVWMGLIEARTRRLWLWLPLLACLGNMATCIFLLARLGRARSIRAWLTERM